MTKRKLPKSVKKYIRRQKAKLRRQIQDSDELEQKINELLARFGINK